MVMLFKGMLDPDECDPAGQALSARCVRLIKQSKTFRVCLLPRRFYDSLNENLIIRYFLCRYF